MCDGAPATPLDPPLPSDSRRSLSWAGLHGASRALAITKAAEAFDGLVLAITPDTPGAQRLHEEIAFFRGARELPALQFPDWETLPYDVFSPHQDIVSERLATLARLPTLDHGILIVPVTTLMVRTVPRSHIDANSLSMAVGAAIDLDEMRGQLDQCGYRRVSQVMEHGEFAVRGSLLDVYPMGIELPVRVDLLDREIDSIRTFSPDTQRTAERIDSLRLLPAREYPTKSESIGEFRQAWRARFEGDPSLSPIYRDVSQGLAPAGIEYYLALFFGTLGTLFDFIPSSSLVIYEDDVHPAAEKFWTEVTERYEQSRYDRERPLVPPTDAFATVDVIFSLIKRHRSVKLDRFGESTDQGDHLPDHRPDHSNRGVTFASRVAVSLPVNARAEDPLFALRRFLAELRGRALLVAETTGRRETLLETLRGHGIRPEIVDGWDAFLASQVALGITVARLDQGAWLEVPGVAIIAESQLFGDRATQRRRRRGGRDSESIVRDLTELSIGAPVVHEDHGVGRYLGLETIATSHTENEYLCLEYADHDKLYVPVSSLHLITRYTGGDLEHAPLHPARHESVAPGAREGGAPGS